MPSRTPFTENLKPKIIVCYRYTYIKKLKSLMVAVCTNFRVVLIFRDKEKVKDWERGFCYINDVYFLGKKKT